MGKDCDNSKETDNNSGAAGAGAPKSEVQGSSEANEKGPMKSAQQTSFQLEIEDKWRDKSHAELRREIESQLKNQGLSDAPNEFIDHLVTNVSKDLRRKTRSQRLKNVAKTSIIAFMVSTFAILLNVMSERAEGYVPREELRAALTHAIEKDAGFDDVKLVYQHELNNNPVDTIWPLVKPHLYYEKSALSLLLVLNDLKVMKLTASEGLGSKDVDFISRVDALVLDHNRVNPFDGLDEQSLRDFRGISIKLNAEEYEKIKDELMNLNSSIKLKNSLIGQYLNSSNLSLYVSVAAFIFSIIVAIWQLFPRKASQKQLIAEVVNEHMAKNS
ncbi:hypothetical protein QU617_16860 [Pseudomonas guariconensis]|uniref:hypothetical protein n=1 Tax=Pseudomonas guariconensis TaxID=1288410 RepID=UPI0025A985AB|nr:hypothetical protein [Pseudomonas guariconensis]MDM9594978.1 hypothetical protein [Pseudomonas guariconensis]MDM9607809.1 hypothetical protein [Pseudomonas guariconensis]MDM9612766.1 hypothetical protein [Pseudomonas guariconensis]